MPNLDRALIDIAAMRSHLARSTEFRGYGPATLALTGLLALLAAGTQALWLPDAGSNVSAYLALWIATAIMSVVIIGIEAVTRSRRMHSGLADEMIRQAVEQFLPAAAAGVLLHLFSYAMRRNAVNAARPLAYRFDFGIRLPPAVLCRVR